MFLIVCMHSYTYTLLYGTNICIYILLEYSFWKRFGFAGSRAMMTPLITSEDDVSFSPRPTSESSRHLSSRPTSPVSMSYNNVMYSPPRPLDLTPKSSAAMSAASHMLPTYLSPTFAGLMASAATSGPGLVGHGTSFGPSGKCMNYLNVYNL